MNLGGGDLATVSGLAVMNADRVIKASTFRAAGKKKFLDRDGGGLDAMKEGDIGRAFEDHFRCWLIDNEIGHMAIEAPVPSSGHGRRKPVVDTEARFAGQAITYQYQDATNLSANFRSWGLEFLACSVCRRLNIPVVLVNQSTWRKEFLGNGRPKDPKHEAKRMCETLGIECSSLDAAEACGVVTWLDRTLNPYQVRKANDLFEKVAAK